MHRRRIRLLDIDWADWSILHDLENRMMQPRVEFDEAMATADKKNANSEVRHALTVRPVIGWVDSQRRVT